MQAFFLPFHGTRRFCLFHQPRGVLRGALLHVHPFAEEMNLSRRMAAMQARVLAEAGYAVLQIDLFGCGDSEGDFGEAAWTTWIGDIIAAANWLQDTSGHPPGFWGVRAGCLLAVEAARAIGQPARFLFWQPVVSGEAHWRQFLRIQLAGEVIAETGGIPAVRPRHRADGEASIEVAGYRVSPELLSGLVAARLELPPTLDKVICVELNASGARLTPALAAKLEAWQADGHQVCSAALPGPAFWQTPDADECPALVETTTGLLEAEWP